MYDTWLGTAADRFFKEHAEQAGFRELGGDRWPFEGGCAAIPAENVVFADGHEFVLRAPDGTLSYVNIDHGWFHVRVAAKSQAAVNQTCSAFRTSFPASFLVDDNRVPITFWADSPHGPIPRLRKVEGASWQDIEGNYTADVKQQLRGLMEWSNPKTVNGQLLLWQGPPGTGKSWSLRALASEWSQWAEFHYITDPDAFFVDNPSYMVSVLLADSYDVIEETSGDVYQEADPLGKWRILILEDTGELLSANAKEKYGQGLSRLLNVVDGMIGQGLRVLALVTTNDELSDLHPAVTRPGRCASQIVFAPMTGEEVAAWTDGARTEPMTVAELYAYTNNVVEAFPDEMTAAGAPNIDYPEIEAVEAEDVNRRSPDVPPEDAEPWLDIDPDAQKVLDRYWADHSADRVIETQEHGFDPVDQPQQFWKVELDEPVHADVKAAVERGPFTESLAERWVEQEEDAALERDEAAANTEFAALLEAARTPLTPGTSAMVASVLAQSPLTQLLDAHRATLKAAENLAR